MNDHIERLIAMSNDNGETWDLSDNDKAALAYAVKAISVIQFYATADAENPSKGVMARDFLAQRWPWGDAA